MAKDDVLEDGFGYAQEQGDLFIEFATLVRKRLPISMFVNRSQHPVELFEGHCCLPLRYFHAAHDDHARSRPIGET